MLKSTPPGSGIYSLWWDVLYISTGKLETNITLIKCTAMFLMLTYKYYTHCLTSIGLVLENIKGYL